ncbi:MULTISPECIES: hypothetical protein [unclassified Microbacterium]|uniref:hypothetical protein n=1 Tax=unclassified Microbacterium TaxID=2609290 RepID=UPI0030161D82
MGDEVIPARKVVELLHSSAEDRALNAVVLGAGVSIMCAACYPRQPERLQYSARRVRPVSHNGDAPWWKVLLAECDGVVSIRFPRTLTDPRALILAEDAVDALSVTTCCHGEDEALGGWDWRSGLADALEEAVATTGDEWNEEWERLRRERERVQAADEAAYDAFTLMQMLPPRIRVQAFAAVLQQAGHPVVVEQARVSWECGDSDENGRWVRVSYVLDADRGMIPAHDTCGQHPEEDPSPLDLAAEYRRVLALSDAERAAYAPVPEKKRGSGWPRGGGTVPKKAPRRDEWPASRTKAWCVEHGLDIAAGINTLFKAVVAAEPDEAKRPTKAAIITMKKAQSAG